MIRSLLRNQRGIGHFGIVLLIFVLLGLGGAAYLVYAKNNPSGTDQALKNARCEYDDKDLCKFFASFKARQDVTMVVTNDSNGQKNTVVIKRQGDNRSHLKIEGSLSREIITIGDVSYTKAG